MPGWSIDWPLALAALAIGYGFGSIPFGLILTKIAGTTDIRSIGSGNIGATNVLRTGRKGLAAATLLCDVLKGTAAVLVAAWFLGREAGLLAGLGAFLGHLFPVWLGFKGGKGVATFIGALIAVGWPVAVAFGAVWGAVAWASRYSSLAALCACGATPVLLWRTGRLNEALVFLLMAVLVFIMHRGNIQRLIAGTESKIGQKG